MRRVDPDCLVAAIDSRIARLWLRLGPRQTADRCDLLAIRRDAAGGFRLTCIEVKTTRDAVLADEADRVDRAAVQIAGTAEVIRSALSGEDRFAAPRLEMLKEVLVRAAGARWDDPASDSDRRRRWGPWLTELFGDQEEHPQITVDGEVVLVKLRSAEPARSRSMRGTALPITVRTITEALAEELLSITEQSGNPAAPTFQQNAPEPLSPDPDPASEDLMPTTPDLAVSAPVEMASPLQLPVPDARASASSAIEHALPSTQQSVLSPKLLATTGETWPPPLNSLGMIGQIEAAQELANLARMSEGWGKRFPDKLLVGPAGVGKSTVARRMGETLLGLTPILFNGADLRRPEMIVERLAELKLIPARRTGTVIVAPCLIFIDEVHAIAPSVATALLSALDDRRTTTVGNVIYSFENAVFLLATTDPGKLTEAFLSRPTRTTLRSYALNEMAGIVWLHAKDTLKGAELSREACVEIAARMQCSPRPSVNILGPLVAHFFGEANSELDRVPTEEEVASRITVESVAEWFQAVHGIDANGLGPVHQQFLAILRQRGPVSEDELRRSLGISNRGDFVEVAEYLTRLGLIQVGPGGRNLTSDGRKYLSSNGDMNLRDRISRRSG
jgi:Holliday junction resolvasome RuvABC ATP-dependent DNA helicase subunit